MATSSDITIDLVLPTSWSELTDRQLRYVFSLLAADFTSDEVKIHCLLHWSGLRVRGRNIEGHGYRCKLGTAKFVASATQIAELLCKREQNGACSSSAECSQQSGFSPTLSALSWLDEMPTEPVCIRRLRRHRSIAPDFSGVAFEKFIVADNLYQGFLATGQEPLLDQLLAVLYQFPVPHSHSSAERISAFYWFASVKACFARLYPHFFQPSQAESANLLGSPRNSQSDTVNSMIRALTKGDITKEREILAFDMHRALTELDAQAREYQEFNKKYPSK